MTQASAGSGGLAKGLGYFSIGLGIVELAIPRRFGKFIGVGDDDRTAKLLRIYGARELAAGVGILALPNKAAWLWSRVAGDGVDLSSLGKAMTSPGTSREKTIATTAAVTGVTALDVYCAQKFTRNANSQAQREEQRPDIATAIIINRSPEEVYGFWRDFTRLPEIINALQSVQPTGNRTSHWTMQLPGGKTIEWDAQTTADEPNSRIAWQTTSSAVRHTGSVTFKPATGNRGTQVTVMINLQALGPKLGKLAGFVPEQQVNIALHNLKQLMETGEIVKSDASIYPGMHPAQPPEGNPSNLRSRSAAVAR